MTNNDYITVSEHPSTSLTACYKGHIIVLTVYLHKNFPLAL